MFVDLRALTTSTVPAGTVLVVGSGPAGLALAERLALAGRPVLLVESGGDLERSAGTDAPAGDLNAGTSLGLPYTGLVDGRTRRLGGTTQLWHGQCMRLHEIDLQARPWVAFSGWPLSLADLGPGYAGAERWLGVSGRGYGPERWREHAELTPLEWDASRLLHDFTEYTPNPMLARERRPALAANRSLRIVVDATVGRVLTDAAGVRGVEVFDSQGARVELAAAQVVLAAGALENPRLLQLSDPQGIGLGTGRQHTGRFLQDHPTVRMAQVIPRDYRVLQDRYVALHRGRYRLFPKVRLAPQAQRRFELLDATAVFVHDHQQPALAAARRILLAARARRLPERAVRDAVTALRAPAPVIRDAYRRYARGLSTGVPPSSVWLQLWLEQVPDPDSRITLGSSVDALGQRRAQVQWRTSDQERHTSRQLTRWIAEDLRRLGLGEVRELPPMTDDHAWREAVTDAFHPAGTTRMALSPSDGVVDLNLQVHGVPGLYAVGGSVFPTSGYANPTLTIVALALRLADHLRTLAPRVR